MIAKKSGPDAEFGPRIAAVLHDFAMAIAKDSGASGVRVVVEFNVRVNNDIPQGKGKLDMKTFTTPDAKTERMLDPNVSMPRGSKLADDAFAAMRNTFALTATALQPDAVKKMVLLERMAKELLAESEKLSPDEKLRRWTRLIPLIESPMTP